MVLEQRKKWFLLVLPILSGIFLGIGFVFPALKFTCWFAIVPLLFFLNTEKISTKKSFLGGFIAGFIFLGQILIWLFDTLPLDWNGVNNQTIGFLGILLGAWLPFVTFMALFFGLFSLSYYFLKKNKWFDLLLVPSLWIIFEYLRSFGFSILNWGKGSLLGPHWAWDNLAYLLNNNQPLRLLASIGGIYLISFLIVLANVFFYLFIKNTFLGRKSKILSVFGILLLTGLIIFSYQIKINYSTNPAGQKVKIDIIQTDFPAFFSSTMEDEFKRFKNKYGLFEEAYKNSPDIIIFPEDSRFLTSVNQYFFQEKFKEKRFFIIDSSRTETALGIKSIITLLDSNSKLSESREKILLSPLGEYMPYFLKWPIGLFNKDWVNTFEKSRGYIKGDKINIFSVPNGWNVGAFLCSEIFSPGIHREMIKQGAEFLVNMGSLSFSHGSKILRTQTESILQFRAIENGRYLARATNMGNSYIIDNRGNIIKKSLSLDPQIISGEIVLLSRKTPYTKYGDWILIISLSIAIIYFFIKIRKRLIYNKTRN